jgi:hypothetical protein
MDAHRIALQSLEPQEVVGLLFAIHLERERSNGVLSRNWRPRPVVPVEVWCPPMAYARQYGVVDWPPIERMSVVLQKETGISCHAIGDELLVYNCEESTVSDLNWALERFVARRKEFNIACLIVLALFLHILSWMVLAGWPLTFIAERQNTLRMWIGVIAFWTFPSFLGVYYLIERFLRRKFGEYRNSRPLANHA